MACCWPASRATAASTCPRRCRGSPRRPSRRWRGGPMPRSPRRLIAPFTGDCFAPGTLRAMTEEAYATFRHPAVVPVSQLDANLFLLEIFHGPTLAFKDVAMQLLGRMMQEVLGRSGRRTTIVGATSGDTGAAAIEAFRGLPGRRRLHPVSARSRVGRAAPPDDGRRRAQHPRHRHRGHLRRLPGHREGHVQPPRLPRRDEPVGREFHQLGAGAGPARLLLHRRGGARRPAPQALLRGADRAISATCWRAGSPSAWACRSSGSSSPPTRTTS